MQKQKRTLIQNTKVVFGDQPGHRADILIVGNYIEQIGDPYSIKGDECEIIGGTNLYCFPGLIDDQVHFREPGLTHKATIYTESKAAVAGGVTTFMEMPNTIPNAVTVELLEDKYKIASSDSLANFSFFMGTTNSNLDEIINVDPKKVCGIKIFMGSSTGNMLVDDEDILEKIFKNVQNMLIATHCEDDPMITQNLEALKGAIGEENIFARHHPHIRNAEACYSSSAKAVRLAQKHGTRLHVLHISTEKELSLFRNDIPLEKKRITAEVCVHHLTFNEGDYETLGYLIKCNPAIKTEKDRLALWDALLDDRLDIIATDHAPHTLDEKSGLYLKAMSGVPLVQHSLNIMLQHCIHKKISLQKIAQKMCNNPATLFRIDRRGFIREGYYADLVLVDSNRKYKVSKGNILHKCGWSPFEGETFDSKITHTFVNGHLAYHNGKFDESHKGMRALFNVD